MKISVHPTTLLAKSITLIAVTLCSASPLLAQTTNSTWTLAGNGNWADAANWDTADFPNNGQPNPGDTYNAILNTNRTITVDQDITIQGFTQSTGTVTGAANRTFTFQDTFTWTGGMLTGGMTVNANGGVSVSNNVHHNLGGATIFNNNGTMTWTQGDLGNTSESWTFNNNAGGTININFISSAQTFGSLSGGNRTIVNVGTINVLTPTYARELDIQSPTQNSGLIDIIGTTKVTLRGVSNTGQIQVAAGGAVQFASNSCVQSGAGSITGAGTVLVHGGSYLTLNPGTTYNVGSTLVFASDMIINNTATTGTLDLFNTGRLMGNGTLIVNGLFTWTGNGGWPDYYTGISQALTVEAHGGMTMNGTTKDITEGGTVRNFGHGTWTSGILRFKDNGGGVTTRFINEAGATLDMQFDGQILAGGVPSTNHFINNGTFTKSGGTGTSQFNVVVSNNAGGEMNINSGTLSVGVSLSNAGDIEVASGATLTFGAGATYTQTAGSLLLAGGSVSKSGSALAINGGLLGGSGTINGSVAITSATLAPGNSAGNLTISGDLTVTADTIWNFEIGGTNQGTQYDFVSEAGSTQFNLNESTLQLSLINSFTPDPLDTFTIFSSNNSILGTFGNLDGFGRAHFTEGSFLVTSSGNQIILSDFQAVPEPSSAALLLISILMGVLRRRRC
jgi:hypothetical protein